METNKQYLEQLDEAYAKSREIRNDLIETIKSNTSCIETSIDPNDELLDDLIDWDSVPLTELYELDELCTKLEQVVCGLEEKYPAG